MDRSEYYYDIICNNQPCQDLNKQFDCNTRTPTTRYFFDLNKSGYAQGLYSNVKVYQTNPNEFNKEIKNNPLNIINQK
jgi:hypothetical protein